MTFRGLRSGLLALCLCALVATAATAAPAQPTVGPFIEDGAYYEGQTKCSPWAKPGVVAFQQMVLEAYPGTGAGSIGRDCSVGGTSEHKEGRAWDWGVNVGVPSEKAAAGDLLDWLALEDAYGNRAAMARRLGVMYAIWNKRVWFPGSGWRVYCVDREGACRDPETGGVRHPHTDHVHFSFTWAGAKKKTTFWKTGRSYAAAATDTPSGGLLVLGRNGAVRTFGPARYYGSKSSGYLKNEAVAVESTPAGDGYWILTKRGRVFGLGEAHLRGYASDILAADLASTSTGSGYWVLGRGGGLFAFGDAAKLPATSGPVEGNASALATTPSGAGYWVLHDSGAVESYGDAQHHGDAWGTTVDLAGTPSGQGYWTTTPTGHVQGFGDAASWGDLSGTGASNIVEIVSTSTGDGYWLITDTAAVHAFGDATAMRANETPMTRRTSHTWFGSKVFLFEIQPSQ